MWVRHRFRSLACLCMLAACEGATTGSTSGALGAEVNAAGPELVQATWRLEPRTGFAHLGHDQRDTYSLIVAGETMGIAEGSLRWQEHTLFRMSDGTLRQLEGAALTTISTDVVGEPVVHGPWLALVRRVGDTLRVRRHGPGGDVEHASALVSIGALRVADDGALIGIGAPSGGVAGYWRLLPDEVCLTNCALRAGRGFDGPGQHFEPALGSYTIEGEQLEVTHPDGRKVRVPWR